MVLEVTARAEVNESHFLISSEFPRQEPLKSQQGLAFPLFFPQELHNIAIALSTLPFIVNWLINIRTALK